MIVGGLVVLAIALLGVAWKIRPDDRARRVAALCLAVAFVISAAATLVLALRTVTYDEPVLRRGWASLLNISAIVAIGLFACARWMWRPRSTRSV